MLQSQGYAPIEGEALAVADALDKARHFVLGCSNLVVAVDHKPLCKLFGDRSLEDIPNTRLRNLKEKTLRYRFSMFHIPGIRNKTSDALSRHPTGATNPAKMPLQDDVTAPTVDCPRSSPKIPSSLLAGISIAPQSEEDDQGLPTAMCAAVSNTPPRMGRHPDRHRVRRRTPGPRTPHQRRATRQETPDATSDPCILPIP